MSRLRPYLLLLLLFGCSEDDPVQPGDATLHFEPAAGTLELEAYAVADFRAVDERGSAVTARWWLQGADQGLSSSFRFLGSTPGAFELRALAERNGVDYAATWILQVGSQSSSITPPIGIASAVPGAVPGSIQLSWENPPASLIQVPLRDFELFVSVSAFGSPEIEQMTPVVRPLDPNQIQQLWRVDGLPERQNHFLRLRVVDVLDRRSELSGLLQSESTGHFDLTGSVERLAPGLPAMKGPGVLIELGPHKVVTDQFGGFALLALPDLLREPLTVAEESGISFYEYRSLGSWPVLTQNVDVTLFAKDFVFIDDGPGGFPDVLSSLEYARWMTHNANLPVNTPQIVFKWESYPVEVYAPPFSHQGAELVDYGLAFRRGVAAWNERAGEELLRLVDAPVSVGVDYSADIAPSDPFLGDTMQLSPTGGLFRSIPQRLRIRLKLFNFQEVADRIVAHELGHVLMLNHSPSNSHLMVVGAVVDNGDWPHRDEAFVARLVRHVPQQMDLRIYRDPSSKSDWLLPPLPDDRWCGVSPLRFGRPN